MKKNGMKRIVITIEEEVLENADKRAKEIMQEQHLRISRAELIRQALRNEFLGMNPQKQKKRIGKIIWKIPNNRVMGQEGVFWESNDKIQQYRAKIQKTKAGTKERTEALSEYEKMLNEKIKKKETVEELLLFRED